MNRKLVHGAAMALLVALSAPGLGHAQARNGNVWNGRAHEPDAGSVGANERAAGIAPPTAQQEQESRDLDRMGQALTDKANRDAVTAPAQPRPPNPNGR
jgi:hypothetical protein